MPWEGGPTELGRRGVGGGGGWEEGNARACVPTLEHRSSLARERRWFHFCSLIAVAKDHAYTCQAVPGTSNLSASPFLAPPPTSVLFMFWGYGGGRGSSAQIQTSGSIHTTLRVRICVLSSPACQPPWEALPFAAQHGGRGESQPRVGVQEVVGSPQNR